MCFYFEYLVKHQISKKACFVEENYCLKACLAEEKQKENK